MVVGESRDKVRWDGRGGGVVETKNFVDSVYGYYFQREFFGKCFWRRTKHVCLVGRCMYRVQAQFRFIWAVLFVRTHKEQHTHKYTSSNPRID